MFQCLKWHFQVTWIQYMMQYKCWFIINFPQYRRLADKTSWKGTLIFYNFVMTCTHSLSLEDLLIYINHGLSFLTVLINLLISIHSHTFFPKKYLLETQTLDWTLIHDMPFLSLSPQNPSNHKTQPLIHYITDNM